MRDGGELGRVSLSLALFLPVSTAHILICLELIDIDLYLEEGVVSREERPLLGVEETRTRTIRYLRCGGGPHLHEFVTGGGGGEPKLSFAVEVEFRDGVGGSVSTGQALWGGDGGHG